MIRGSTVAAMALLLAGCVVHVPPYRALQGQSVEQMSADVKECRRAVATTEELAGQPLSDQAGVNLGQLAAEERQCMQARGYCSMSTYDAGYWANDGKGNYTWHGPVKGAGRQCLEATTR